MGRWVLCIDASYGPPRLMGRCVLWAGAFTDLCVLWAGATHVPVRLVDRLVLRAGASYVLVRFMARCVLWADAFCGLVRLVGRCVLWAVKHGMCNKPSTHIHLHNVALYRTFVSFTITLLTKKQILYLCHWKFKCQWCRYRQQSSKK
jgi:hypothetical protein